MTYEQIILLAFGATLSIYALGVYTSNSPIGRWVYVAIVAISGAIAASIPETMELAPYLFGLLACTFAHGWAVGGRCADTGMSKLHAIWAIVPFLWIGLAIPASKNKAVLA